MLCLQVRLISERCVMACAAAQTSPELKFRKMKMLRDPVTDGHVCTAGHPRGPGGIKGCKWPSPLNCWETMAMSGQRCVPSCR